MGWRWTVPGRTGHRSSARRRGVGALRVECQPSFSGDLQVRLGAAGSAVSAVGTDHLGSDADPFTEHRGTVLAPEYDGDVHRLCRQAVQNDENVTFVRIRCPSGARCRAFRRCGGFGRHDGVSRRQPALLVHPMPEGALLARAVPAGRECRLGHCIRDRRDDIDTDSRWCGFQGADVTAVQAGECEYRRAERRRCTKQSQHGPEREPPVLLRRLLRCAGRGRYWGIAQDLVSRADGVRDGTSTLTASQRRGDRGPGRSQLALPRRGGRFACIEHDEELQRVSRAAIGPLM